MIFSKYFLEATYRILRNITIQSIFHCLDMFFLLPQGKYSRILETMEIEEDNCSPYLVPRISSNKQTERNRERVTSLHSESSNHKQYVGPGLFLPTQRRYITLHSSRSEIIKNGFFKDRNFENLLLQHSELVHTATARMKN